MAKTGDALFLVMECIAGETLDRRLLVYLGLGDRASTLDNLERALAADSQMMPWIGRDGIFDPIRSEPRFVALLNKMGGR